MLLAAATSSAVVAADEAKIARWHDAFSKEVRPILEAKCLTCHAGEKPEGDFDLAPAAKAERPIDQAGVWDRVAGRVRLNEMPPAGSPGLSDPEKAALHRWFDSRPGRDLCDELATDETKSWYRGRVMSRRLTNAEYDRMVAALMGVDLRPARTFPADGAGGEGFDTTGDTLFTSPIHLERYLSAADEVVETVVTEAAPAAGSPLLAGWTRWVGPGFEPTAERVRERVAAFATAAWRRPIKPDELDRLLVLAAAATAADARPLDGLREAMKAVLVSPHFLFLVEPSPAGTGVHPLTGRQLAARLGVLLWSSLPDDELLQLADTGRLSDETVLREQVRRMLRDPRSRGLAEDFGLQWLELRNFSQRVAPDREAFPEFDAALAADFREEVVRVVHRVFAEDRSLLELVDAPAAPLTARLAAHYGLPWPDGGSEPQTGQAATDGWRLVTLADGRRGGVITTAAVLAGTSYPKRTSPVLRGQWVLGQVLGGKVPPPPPGVPPLEESHAGTEPKTLRQRLEAHRTNPSCASCHDRMDPIGFGLENYDVLGRWRSEDAGQPVDATGTLPPGGSFTGPEELKRRLLDRREEFVKHLTRKLLGYALGRELDEFDQCVVDRTAKLLPANDFRAALLVEEIVVSHPFRHRYHKMEPVPGGR